MQPRQRASQFLFYDVDHLTNCESEGAMPKRSSTNRGKLVGSVCDGDPQGNKNRIHQKLVLVSGKLVDQDMPKWA